MPLAALLTAEPAPATIIKIGGGTIELDRIPTARVQDETMEGISYLKDTNSSQVLKLSRGSYRVIYAEPGDLADYKGARTAEDEGRLDDALLQYQAAAEADRYRWVVERALLGQARCLLARSKPDTERALALLKTFEDRFPASVMLPQAWALRARAQVAKGQTDAALATYAALADKGKAWGKDAFLLGGRGQAQLLAEKGRQGEAAAILERLVQLVDQAQDPAAWASLVLAQARARWADERGAAGGNKAAARALWLRIAEAPVPAAYQAEARLGLARAAFEEATTTPTLLAAYDQAAMAAAIVPGSAVAIEAKAFLRTVVERLSQAADLTPAEKAEHQAALANL